MSRLEDMQTEMGDEDHGRKMRLRAYWVLSASATFIYLLFGFLLLMVPGVEPVVKVWLLSFSAVLLATPLTVGLWKANTSDAPLTLWPMGTIVGVVLTLEFVNCVIQLIAQLLIFLRRH
jgi:hypothetical protein